MGQLPDDAPAPRLCYITKSSPTEEYGYNLHAEKGRGQFVGLVDKDSPADVGGLRSGDRIFAVNGHSIIGENHKKVVQRIKEHQTHCEMLVLDEEGCKYYSDRDIPVTLSLPNIIRVDKTNSRSVTNSTSNNNSYYPGHQSSEPVFVPPPPPTHDNNSNMDKPYPLLCRLDKNSASDEFGFNLHAEKERGHYIGAVDQGGIGDKAGLRKGQRIVGVNGALIYPHTTHKNVVELIKKTPLSTSLLVVSEEVDNWYKEHNEPFSFDYSVNGFAKQLSPHSIQISDEEIHDSPIKHEEHPVLSTIEVEEPVHQYEPRGVTYDRTVSIISGGPTSDDALLDAIFSAVPGLDATNHVVTSPDLSRTERTETQSSIVEHHGHSRAPSEHSFDRVSLGRESAVDVPNYDPYITKTYDNHSDTMSQTHQPISYNHHHHRGSPSTDDNDIFHLSAREARERLRPKKDRRGLNMTLDEKYRLVSNM